MLDPSTSSQSQLTVRPFNRSGACHHVFMSEDEPSGGSFEDTLREIARELGRSVERAVDNIDVDEFAQMFGVDTGRGEGVGRERGELAAIAGRAGRRGASDSACRPSPRTAGEDRRPSE